MIATKAKRLDRLRARRSELWSEIGVVERTIHKLVDELIDEVHNDHPPTEREQQVIQLVRNRKSDKEIGAALNIATRTAKFHVSRLLHKYGVQSRHDL